MSNHYRTTWDRWEEVDALFREALDLPSAGRAEFLAEACGQDRELLEAVQSLLATEAEISEGAGGPGRAVVQALLSETLEPGGRGLEPGDRVGRYRVLGELGRGGMATVYEAERADGTFDRRVAVKVLRRGLDTEVLVRRFLVERQLLSGLTHPNIATLLDGGATDDGRPFLVMELVDGDGITTWVERQGLSVRERVELFLQVVEAVAFAHGRMIAHRDLKPSNVLVTEAGLVKLLDFGVAKLLDPVEGMSEELTRLGPAPLTPEYASPEQVLGEQVTAASDVFQLGALLFRLLSGVGPFRDSAARMRGAGLDEAIPRPSEVASSRADGRALRGDLDTIVLKALRREPELRYGSADALGADLRRHLSGEPIEARPASPLYRLAKFAARNRWFWPVAATVAIGFGGYLATVIRYSDRLEVERNQAVAEAERAEAIRAFMINQFGAADPYSDDPVGPDVTVVDAMASGAESARRELAGQPLLQAEMLSAIASVYGNLSLSARAADLLEEAMDLRRQVGEHDSPEQVHDLGVYALHLGEVGQRDSAHALLLESVARERAMFGNEHPRVAEALERLGQHRFVDAEYAEALEWYEEAAHIRRSSEPLDVVALSSTLGAVADTYRWADRWDEALEVATEAHDIALRELGEEHAIAAQTKLDLAQVLQGMGRHDRAITLYREALPVLERTLGTQHATTLNSWNNLGYVLDGADDLEGAEQVHRRVLELRLERYGGEQHRDVAASFQNLAAALVRQNRLAEGDSLARRAEQIFRVERGDDHYSVAFSLLTQSEAALRGERGIPAEALLRQAIEILEPAFGPGYPTASASCRLGRALALQGRFVEAEPVVTAALELLESSPGVPEKEITACRGALADLTR